MPFINRLIEPQYLSRKPLDKSVQDDLEAFANSTLVEALKQLACLVVFADEIFQDLTCQVKTIQSRTEKLKSNIERVDKIVSHLNAKEVHVPVGDLDKFSRLTQHYVSPSGLTWSPGTLFTSATRPASVRRLYDTAVVSPVCIIRQTDQYRLDGRRASKYFLCLPFFKDVKVNFDMEIEMRRPASLSCARDWLSDDDTLESIVLGAPFINNKESTLALQPGSDSTVATTTTTTTTITTTPSNPPEADDNVIRALPTPEVKTYVISLRYPYSDVPIDVTGTSFRRMASLRRSFMQHMEHITKRKKKGKRRNTVDLNNGENKTVVESVMKSSGTQTMEGNLSLDSKVGVSDGDVTLGSLKKNKRNATQKKMHFSQRSDQKEVQRTEGEKESGGTFRWFQRKSRNRNSIIGGIGVYEELDRVKKTRRGFLASLIPSSISSTDSGCSPSKSSTNSAVTSLGTTSSGRSISAKNSRNRMSLPISTSSQAVTIAVRMRESSARGNSSKDDGGGQSSSGNWSASSSTRTSMESEEHVVEMTTNATLTDSTTRTGSQTSLDKDSALSDGTIPNEDRWPDSNNDYQSDSTTHSSMRKSSLRFPKRSVETNTARWLQSLDEEGALGRSAGDTTDAASSTGTLTPRIRRRGMSPSEFPSLFVDDGESSEFSVDTDGYYTSMHTDSGLRPLTSNGRRETSVASGKLSRLSDLRERDSNSSLCSLESVGGDRTLRASSSLVTASQKKEVERDRDHSGTFKKIPPLPPPRTSTLTTQSSPQEDSTAYGCRVATSSRNHSVTMSSSSSSASSKSDDAVAIPSDSEASENNERFKQKMSIDTGRIPSLCVVTPSASDDEDERKAQDQSEEVLRAAKEAIDAVSKVGVTSTERESRSPYARPVTLSSTAFTPGVQDWSPDPVLPENKQSPKSKMNGRPQNCVGNVVYEPDVISLKGKSPLEPADKGEPRVIPGGDIKTFSKPQQNVTLPSGIPDGTRSTNGMPPPSIPGSGPCNGRPGARVTLDSTGQVIRSTGSLPRRRSTSMSPVSSPTQEQSATVFPGTTAVATGSNSKCSSQGSNRQGAYVKLDPSGSTPVTRQLHLNNPHPLEDKRSQMPTLNSADQRSLPKNCTAQARKYDSNTLPRWKPPEANRPVPIFPNEAKPHGASGNLQSYHVSTLPRRWNNFNFLRRDTSSPSPKPSVQSSQPEQMVKAGGYLRLDGHPAHLEPGIPSRSGPCTRLTTTPQMQQRSESAQSIVCPSPGANSKSSSPRSGEGVSPPSPPVAMPLMQHLNYGNRATNTRIPTTVPGPYGSQNLVGPTVNRPPEMLPRYYQPLNTGLPSNNSYATPPTATWTGNRGTANYASVCNGQTFQTPVVNPGPPSYVTAPVPPSSGGYPSSVRTLTEATRMSPHRDSVCQSPVASQVSPPSYSNRHARQDFVHQTSGSVGPHGHLGSPSPGYFYSTAGHPQACIAPLGQNGNHQFPSRPEMMSSRGPPQASAYAQPPLASPHFHHGMQRAQTPAGDPELFRNAHFNLPASSPSATPLSSSPASVQRPSPAATPQSAYESPSARICQSPTLQTNSQLSPSSLGSRSDSSDRLDCGTPKGVTSPKSTISTDDLFAIIHQSKKKMNLKTDLDMSISPTSSRSGSPALSVGAQPRNSGATRARLPESGTLVPGSRSPLYVPGDRRSWSGDLLLSSPSATPSKAVSSTTPGDRRSWASDRLGPIRPTSMHNFKLLLLQAGRGNNKEAVERRQSATELLKASPSSFPNGTVEPSVVSPNRSYVQSSTCPPQMSPRRQAASPTKQVYNQGHCSSFSSPPSNFVTSPGRSSDLSSPGGSSNIYARPSPRINLLNSRLQSKPFQGRSRATCSVLHNRTDILSTPIMEDEYSDEEVDDFCGLAVRSPLQNGLNVTPVAAS